MKLIIDIPEHLYKWIKEEYDNPNGEVAYSAIENGTPYEERPQGEWIKIGELGLAYKCNKCGEVDVVSTNFCSNCGADMRGNNNDTGKKE